MPELSGHGGGGRRNGKSGEGDVAAVRAACDAGRTAGARVGDVVAVHVIARPHTGVDMTIPLGRDSEAAKKK